jgi:S-formylglutathione hydrolase
MSVLHSHQTKSQKAFGGQVELYTHFSKYNDCSMNFGLFVPPAQKELIPVLWLSGLTCSEINFMTKGGALSYASKHGLLLIVPDTSPRNIAIPEADDSWDFGSGASFYVNATQEPWARHYKMADYLVKELVPLILQNFYCYDSRVHIMGHSMGGHGALTLGLRNPDLFASISAFAPILNPTKCPWGEKAFKGYLGDSREQWKEYDATCLVAAAQGENIPLLIDQGLADEFLEMQLGLTSFKEAAAGASRQVEYRMRPDYDHSYFYISTFIEEHFDWHLMQRGKTKML